MARKRSLFCGAVLAGCAITLIIHLQSNEPIASLAVSPSLSSASNKGLGKPSLSPEDVDGVEKFVLFVGYRRSGHSFIGSVMDAHPNMIISHEFFLLGRWSTEFHSKTHLFNQLYLKSQKGAAVGGLRSDSKNIKGYSLHIDSLWQASFTQLKVIGDKSGGAFVDLYTNSSEIALKNYKELVETVKVPVRVMHVIRNPYDMIATGTLYHCYGKREGSKLKNSEDKVVVNQTALMQQVNEQIVAETAVEEMIEKLGLVVFEVHIEEFIKDPKGILQRICEFLQVECSQNYLQICYEQTFKSISRTRDSIVWGEEALSAVKDAISRFPAYRGYSFEDDFWNPPVQ